ncbi:MAG: cysteine--tRNA ligase [Zestosphaera tikiterensis]|uniref:Cysteine--tRNA ligase n=1 Tax=Zestosphaera tikiterensis TaxID=1973259 RepID=A0A2R7Y8U6_9CREN|nr:MAG: cysteine--tRNA ligase [Zestosphaera tikiterensis]
MTTFANLKIYNTRTRQIETFKPLNGNRVFMFVCGPTVYDYSHVGHARVFIFFDVVARWLRKLGYSLFYIVNITDVDDKIINRARDEKIHPLELARTYERYFMEDMISLNVTSPNLYARASDYINEIFDQIRVLIDKGHAYVTPTGVYFDITSFEDYGKLSGRDPSELVKHRIEPDPSKRNPGDFALWRVRPREEFGWESPWGFGRPGWHIEDTAITLRHFGPQYDIHGGAVELIFPHHEAEVAQAESYTGVKPFVNFWIHVGLLTVQGEKMSKSLGNYVTIREAVSKYGANALRLYILQTHYRSPIDFSWEGLESAYKSASRIETSVNRLQQLNIVNATTPSEDELTLVKKAEDVWSRFADAMNNDLNTAQALSAYFELISQVNDYTNKYDYISAEGYGKVWAVVKEINEVLGLKFELTSSDELIKNLIELIVNVRGELRKRRLWDLSDGIRDSLKRLGIELQDTATGTKWVLRRTAKQP